MTPGDFFYSLLFFNKKFLKRESKALPAIKLTDGQLENLLSAVVNLAISSVYYYYYIRCICQSTFVS